MKQSKIGIIGMGVMGQNIARNFASKKNPTVVTNRTPTVTTSFIKEHGSKYLSSAHTLYELIEQVESPRVILIMVKSGEPVDSIIQELIPLLSKNDIIIDGGNSNYTDTIRRSAELESHHLHFIGCGISGGEEGALHGPSLMPGGSMESWKRIQPLFKSIAAKDFSGNPCVAHIGSDGAGHFVKMVHNGIEYAVMQLIAESYDLLRKAYHLTAQQIASVFKEFGERSLNSFLFDVAVTVLEKKDPESKGYLIDSILDVAGQKGTGQWTVTTALDQRVPLSTISESVFARATSGQKDLRRNLEKVYGQKTHGPQEGQTAFISHLEKALHLSMLICYAQGFHLIREASVENDWHINLSELARIWQGGCIIRADLLKFIQEVYTKSSSALLHLMELPQVIDITKKNESALRTVVRNAILIRVPVPCFSSTVSYIDSITSAELPANLIQGLRDAFGAHTYERTDKSGSFHTQWTET